MPTVAFRTAIRDALDEELASDERVILFGEDVAVAGGVFATTTSDPGPRSPRPLITLRKCSTWPMVLPV